MFNALKAAAKSGCAMAGVVGALVALTGTAARATDFAWSFVESSTDGFGNQLSGSGDLTVTGGVVTQMTGTMSAYDGQLAFFVGTPTLDSWSKLGITNVNDSTTLIDTGLTSYDNGLTATGPQIAPTNNTTHLSGATGGNGLVLTGVPGIGNDIDGIVDYMHIYNISSGSNFVDEIDIYYQGANYSLGTQAQGQFLLSFVPEPASMALLLSGFVGLLAARRRRR